MNRTETPIETLSRVIAHTKYHGLSLIVEDRKNWAMSKAEGRDVVETVRREPTERDFEIMAMFPQQWGSTALGFDDIGGAAMTTAYTIVVRGSQGGEILVYFDDRFAYRISRPGEAFWNDVAARNLAAVSDAGKYETMR